MPTRRPYHLLGFERHHQPVLPWGAFLARFSIYLAVVLALIYGALKVGEWGYRHYEGLQGADAFLNAAMILGGMGPVAELHTTAGKRFAGAYALFSGLFVIGVMGILLTPWVHRLLHHLHAEPQESDSDKDD